MVRLGSLCAVVALLLGVAGCSGQRRSSPAPPRRAAGHGREMLGLAQLGRLFGTCPGRGRFTLTLVTGQVATDEVAYRVGGGRVRRVWVDPGRTLRIPLPTVRRYNRDRTDYVTLTQPVALHLVQPREPHTLTARVRLRLGNGADGERDPCVLVDTRVRADTDFHRGP